MELATADFEKLPNETNTGDFENLKTYYGFLFDFGNFNDNQEEEVLLDTQGLWEAVITLIKDDLFVQGVATFNVGGIGNEQETSDSTVYEIVTNQIVHNLNQRALKVQTILVINNWDELDLDEYEEGQLLLRNSDGMLFKVVVENETKDLEQVARFVTIVDDELSNTSENPVQNKVINSAINGKLNASNEANSVYTTSGMIPYASNTAPGHTIVRRSNSGYIKSAPTTDSIDDDYVTTKGYVNNKIASAITGVYKIGGARNVSYLNGLTKSSLLNGNVFNLTDSGSLTNADATQISVYAGDNILFIWNNGSWYWDKMAAEFDTSNLAKLNGNNTFSGTTNTFLGDVSVGSDISVVGNFSNGSISVSSMDVILAATKRWSKHRFIVNIGAWYLNFDCLLNYASPVTDINLFMSFADDIKNSVGYRGQSGQATSLIVITSVASGLGGTVFIYYTMDGSTGSDGGQISYISDTVIG